MRWPGLVLIIAGAAAVCAYAVRLAVPSRAVVSVAALGALAVFISQGLGPASAELDRNTRTLVAALVIGVFGRLLAQRADAPAALWLVPAILPLLPAPTTMLPLLAESEAAQQALQGQALATAFLIGVGVASGDILVATYQRYRARVTIARIASNVGLGSPTTSHSSGRTDPGRDAALPRSGPDVEPR